MNTLRQCHRMVCSIAVMLAALLTVFLSNAAQRQLRAPAVSFTTSAFAQMGAPVMKIESNSFSAGGELDKRFAKQFDNLSPELHWSDAPSETVEFALIVDDPDAPRAEPWVHWVAYGIPAEVDELPEGFSQQDLEGNPVELVNGKNSWGELGYGGPQPPRGTHRYFFKLYALDQKLNLKPGTTKHELLRAMQGHILLEAQTMGTFSAEK